MADRKPNILLVMFDQLAPQSLAVHGHPLVKTPHMDGLAADGVVFDAAYCASPLCAPARFSLMAGRLCSAIGAWDNAAEFPAEVPTFSHVLRRAGYRSVLPGKMHFVGPDQLHGFEQRLTTDMYPADFGWTPDWRDENKRWFWYHNMQSVVEAGVYERTLEIDYDEEVGQQAVRKIYDMARDDDTRPWFMTASFMHPHDPFMTPREHWDRYRHDDIDMPRVAPLPDTEMDPHGRRLRRLYAVDEYDLGEERVRNARHAYYGMISWGDDRLGELLHALDVTGQRENTIIVLTSDHGEMLGEHGLWYKMSFRERSARVPLILSAPGRIAARRVAEPVSHLDLLPTLAALAGDAGTRAPEIPLDGDSLVPALHGDSLRRDGIVAEYLAEGVTEPMFMLRRGSLKYIACGDDPPQLFDLEADPDELQNLAALASHADTAAAFAAEVARRWDAEDLRERIIDSQTRRLYVHEAGLLGEPPRWDFQPFDDASRRYNRNLGGELYDTDRNARIPRRAAPAPDGPGKE